ncbi:MAG: hypothetical protein IPM64_10875 [Phycisphaerales bacterium]|nr:hypothetical protein [Phycisphaerales bacterium]
MLDAAVDPQRRRATMAGMTVAAARPLATTTIRRLRILAANVGLEIDRDHPRGRGRRRRGQITGRARLQLRDPRRLLGDASRGRQQSQLHRLGTQRVQTQRRRLIADARLQRRNQVVQHARMHHHAAHEHEIRACALPAQGLQANNLRNFRKRLNCYHA